jgi:hypothetical protein
MAESACHSYPIRLHQILVEIVVGVCVITFGIPALLGFLVEIRVREKAESDHPRGIPIVRSYRYILAARSDFHTRVLRLVLEWVGPAVRISHVEPETITIRTRAGSALETGFVYETHILPSVVTAILKTRVVG